MPQFARYKDTNTFNLPYDYESITHYAAYANSKNGKMTIITKDPKYQNIIGKVNNLSKQVKPFLKFKTILHEQSESRVGNFIMGRIF